MKNSILLHQIFLSIFVLKSSIWWTIVYFEENVQFFEKGDWCLVNEAY